MAGASREFIRKAYSTCWLLLLLVLVTSCHDPLPSEPEPPDPPGPIEDTRKWSQPEEIALLSPAIINATAPAALVAEGDRLHLLLSVPQDSSGSVIPDRFGLAYLFFDGSAWTHRTTIKGFGVFKPAAVVPDPDGTVHIFWAGIREELRQFPTTSRGSDLYYCRWSGNACSEAISLHADPSPGSFRFQDKPHRDEFGRIHLAFQSGPFVRMLEFSSGSDFTVSMFGVHIYPHLILHNQISFLAYMSTPDPPEGQNDLFLAKRVTGSSIWSTPENLSHDPQNGAHVPVVAIDLADRTHVVWFAQRNTGGRYELRHVVSTPAAPSWKETRLLADSDHSRGSPTLLVDESGALHASWGHLAVIPSVEYYHAIWRDSTWSTPQRLFPDIDLHGFLYMAVGTQNHVHTVFLDDSKLYHARFE